MRTIRALLVIAACGVLAYAVMTHLGTHDGRTTPVSPPTGTTSLLHVTSLKDGDSWDASDGREYRLGLVNAPERFEPCYAEATQFTRRFLSDGFTAHAYATDVHGRHIAEVFNRRGRSLNVELAKSGLGNGKYLDRFRRENPELAGRVERALQSAATPSCRAVR